MCVLKELLEAKCQYYLKKWQIHMDHCWDREEMYLEDDNK